jgi:hypothetical protein
MSLKINRKVLKNIPVKSVIFVSIAVMIAVESAWVLKNVNAKDLLETKYLRGRGVFFKQPLHK